MKFLVIYTAVPWIKIMLDIIYELLHIDSIQQRICTIKTNPEIISTRPK